MFLYIVRHASAGERRSADPKKDEKRPLDKEGLEQGRQLGRVLAALKAEVTVVISSPLKRAIQTAALLSNEIGYEAKIVLDDALRANAQFATFRALLAKHKNSEAIIVVGHDPSISQFASRLVSDGQSDACIDLKKGAAAKLELKARSVKLHWCITPKVIRSIYESSISSSRPKSSRK
jgi:phosphohistidine phosphatase